MKIELHSTGQIVELDGTLCRVWQGTTAAGVELTAFVARVAIGGAQDAEQFQLELLETREPDWLVKDFNVLYRAARALADACQGRGDGRPYPPLMALEAQLARLRPAFESTEAMRGRTVEGDGARKARRGK